jgi:hypothetical protein
MKSKRIPAILATSAVLAVLGGQAVLAQGKYTLKISDGLAFSEFRGYETWQVVSVSHPAADSEMSGEVLNVIVANPVMIDAYVAGIPGNGKPFPDGAKTAKIQYIPKKSAEAPANVAIPERLRNVAFMMKDSKRLGASCGVGCHTIVKKKDYVFTAYQKR